jgi:putative MATE family efflux protein
MKSVSITTHTSIVFSIIGAIVLTIIGYFGSGLFLELCRVPEDIFEESRIYMEIFFLGLLGTFIYNMGAGILRAIGDSKRPFYFLIVGCLLNIILDVIFLIPLKMGVAGAALATVISQAVSAILVILCLVKETGPCKLELPKLRMDKKQLYRMLRIGVPAGVQSVTYALSNIIIQASINDFGTDTIAAWGTYGKMDGLFWMTISSFGIALTTFVGQNYGAGKYDRVRKGIKDTMWMATITSVAICSVLFTFAEFFFSLFTPDQAVIQIGARMVHFLMPTYITYIGIEILSGGLRAMGDTFIPMLLSCGGVCGIRIFWIYTIFTWYRSLPVLFISYPISWFITTAAHTINYFRAHRKTRQLYLQAHPETQNA